MGFSALLDVAIGMVFMYLGLSLMCTTLNEIIATFTKLRARNLSKTVTELIDDPDVRAAFYNHGLIANAKAASRAGKPVPGLAAGPNGSGPQAAGAPAGATKGSEATARGILRDPEHPSYFDPKIVAMALLDSLDRRTQDDPGGQKSFPAIADIRSTVEKLPDSNIRDVLLAGLATAGDDLSKLRDSVAAWFDAAMDRLSGAYKRQMKLCSLAVGFAIAVALNADSYAVGKALWNDATLRAAIVRDSTSASFETSCKTDDPGQRIACLVTPLKQLDEQLRPLPIGWNQPGSEPWYAKALGLIWTGLALSLGAPFWFDILQKFMNLRGTGVKPEEKSDAPASG